MAIGIFNPFIVLGNVFLCFLCIFAWVSIGTPRVLKRSAMIAVLMSLLSLIFMIIQGVIMLRFNVGFLLIRLLENMLRNCAISFIPFLCIFINASRYDKSLNFTQSLLSWLKSGPADGKEKKALHMHAQKSKKVEKHVLNSVLLCPLCGKTTKHDAKFCAHCGGIINGQ